MEYGACLTEHADPVKPDTGWGAIPIIAAIGGQDCFRGISPRADIRTPKLFGNPESWLDVPNILFQRMSRISAQIQERRASASGKGAK